MAEYNYIYSEDDNELVEGTEGNDSIKVYGNHSTVQANGGADVISVNGGRHDNGIWLDGDETNVIYAGAGNDSISVQSRGASIFGDSGNDTIRIESGHIFADGGTDNDLFDIPQYVNGSSKDFKVTITGGAGKDTLQVVPYGDIAEVIITDFSNDDVLKIFDSNYYSSYYAGYSRRVITQSVQNGNVVISDNSSINSYGGNTTRVSVDPLFSITLQGVSDISEVADAKYYRYYGTSPQEYKTFAELFGVSAVDTTPPPAADTLAPATGTSSTVIATDDDDDDSTVETVSSATETTTTSASTGTTVSTAATETTTTFTTTTSSTETATTTTSIFETTRPPRNTPTTSAPATTASGGDTIVNNYYGGYYDMSGNNGTIVNQSSVTGAVTNNTSVDNSTTIIKQGDTYTYSGGDRTITNYQQGEIVELASDYAGIDLNGNSFFVKSSSGSLEIQNARDKFIGYSAGGQPVAYSYMASGGGTVDGRGKSQAEIMIGGDNSDNQIIAGNGGSSLWGGIGGNDTLTGGSSYNEFFYMAGGGNDVVQSSNSDDLVNLLGVSISQITNVDINVGQLNVNFIDGGNLKINGDSGVRYRIAEGTFSVNQHTKEWSVR